MNALPQTPVIDKRLSCGMHFCLSGFPMGELVKDIQNMLGCTVGDGEMLNWGVQME